MLSHVAEAKTETERQRVKSEVSPTAINTSTQAHTNICTTHVQLVSSDAAHSSHCKQHAFTQTPAAVQPPICLSNTANQNRVADVFHLKTNANTLCPHCAHNTLSVHEEQPKSNETDCNDRLERRFHFVGEIR